MPVFIVAGVAIFVIWAIVLAGLLLRNDDDPADSAAAIQPSATATASPTPPQAPSTATNIVQTAPTTPAVAGAGTSTAVTSAPTEAAAPEPTSATQPSTSEEPTATIPTTQPSNVAPDSLLNLLPTLDDLPDGFVVTNEESLTLDELAEVHPDPDMQRDRLRGWGFTGAAERDFEIADGSDGTTDGMTLLTALVVAFRTPEDARAAVEASHADAKAADETNIEDSAIEPLGDFALAASGTLTIGGEQLQVAYVIVQIGNHAITFAGGSPTENPIVDVVDVVNRTLN